MNYHHSLYTRIGSIIDSKTRNIIVATGISRESEITGQPSKPQLQDCKKWLEIRTLTWLGTVNMKKSD